MKRKLLRANHSSYISKPLRKAIMRRSHNPYFVTDNKSFWKTIKPFFSNKGNYGSQIKEKDEVLQDDDLIAKELNKFFKNAVSTLNIKENRFITNSSSEGITDPVDKAIDKYKFTQVFFEYKNI